MTAARRSALSTRFIMLMGSLMLLFWGPACDASSWVSSGDGGFDVDVGAYEPTRYARFLPSPASSELGHGVGVRTATDREQQAERVRAELESEADECRGQIDLARQQPALQGAPILEAQRAAVLARGKAEPVLFLEAPRFTGEVSRGIAAHRRRIEQTLFPRDTTLGVLRHFAGMTPELRQLVLRDGYLYTDDPATARELTVHVRLEDLFVEDALTMLRGSQRIDVVRREGLYFYASGVETDERARLLLFDRVWVQGEEPGPALHVDVRELARREGFTQMRVDHLGEDGIVAFLRFGEHWVPAYLEREATRLSLGCLLIEAEEAAEVGRARDAAFRRASVLSAVHSVIAEQIRSGLPFDEPRTERGQQDGKLRQRWEEAYFAGKNDYVFNGDTYPVFDDYGQPLTPQVCIDFVTETLERASGMHFAPDGKTPEKVVGALDFDEILGADRRREMAVRGLARSNVERFDLLDYPMGDWVRYEKIKSFFRFVENEKENLQPGDIVIIRGRAAWDQYREVHSHTFFVYEADPVSGMPTLLAGNSGKPRLVTWDDEMLRAPKRSIRHRLRIDAEWLYDHAVLRERPEGDRWAAPLTVLERG